MKKLTKKLELNYAKGHHTRWEADVHAAEAIKMASGTKLSLEERKNAADESIRKHKATAGDIVVCAPCQNAITEHALGGDCPFVRDDTAFEILRSYKVFISSKTDCRCFKQADLPHDS